MAAFIYLVNAKALASARTAQAAPDAGSKVGVLHGLPIVVKDNTHLAGMPNSAGTLAFKNFVPQDNNPDVQRLLDAVAIVVGNSGSAAVAIAAGVVDIGLGTEPESLCVFLQH